MADSAIPALLEFKRNLFHSDNPHLINIRDKYNVKDGSKADPSNKGQRNDKGQYGAQFLAQSKFIPGMQVVGVADLNSEKARSACISV